MARKIYEPEIPGVYIIRNQKTGMVYVGKAVRIGRRWDYHFHQLVRGAHWNKHLQRSWQKHGPAAFKFEVVVDLSFLKDDPEKLKIELNVQEAKTLKKFIGFCYNKTTGGDGGVVPGSHTRLLMSESQTARFNRKGERERIGKLISEGFNKNNGAGRLKMSKITSERNAVRWADPRNHEKQSKISKERQSSPEYKARHAMIIGASWQNPEHHAKRVAGINNAWQNPLKRAARLEKSKKTREENKRRKQLELQNKESADD